MKKWYSEMTDDALAYLSSNSHDGLSEEEAQLRLNEVGFNELQKKVKRSPLASFLAQFMDFMVLVLLAATIISFILGEIADGITILAIVIINAILGFIQEYRAEKSIEALKDITAPEATVIRQGVERKIIAKNLVPGDIVHITAGDIVPADLRLLEAANLEIQEATLTGESEAVRKDSQTIYETDCAIGDRKNMAYMGTVVVKGQGYGLVVDTGMETEMGKIAGLIQHAEEGQTPLQQRLAQLGKYLVFFCLLIVAVVVVTGIWRGEEPYQMFLVGVSLAVAAIPEGLPAIVTVALAVGVQRMLKERAIVRRLPAVETLGCATVICSDKTGTLTQNAMTVREIYVDQTVYEVTGQGYHLEGDISSEVKGDMAAVQMLLKCAALCNNAQLIKNGRKGLEGARGYQLLGEPTEGALAVAAAKAGIWRDGIEKNSPRLYEIPFDSARKKMSVVYQEGRHDRVYAKGAPDILLNDCRYVLWRGNIVPLTSEIKQQIMTHYDDMAGRALRVLGFAVKEILPQKDLSRLEGELEKDLVFLGLCGMIDPPREEVLPAVWQCHQAGIKVMMITGDYQETAQAIAADLGIYRKGDLVLSGAELDNMDDKKLSRIIEKVSVFARVSPEHKLRIVKILKSKGHVVAMTGDGINDAPAIKEADIGVAMGKTGTDVTKEASAMILSDDNFSTIVSAIREGRGIYDNIRKFIRYLLSCNVGEVLTMFFASLMGLPIPLLPIQILWVNLVTDGLPAMALSVDPIAKDVMERQPRSSKESVFAHGLAYKIALRGMLIGGGTLVAYILGYYFSDGSLATARTMAFTTLVFSQLFHVFDCRSEHFSIFEVGLLSNRFLLAAVSCSVLMQLAVIYIVPLQNVFQTTALNSFYWLIILIISGGMTILFALYRKICALSALCRKIS